MLIARRVGEQESCVVFSLTCLPRSLFDCFRVAQLFKNSFSIILFSHSLFLSCILSQILSLSLDFSLSFFLYIHTFI